MMTRMHNSGQRTEGFGGGGSGFGGFAPKPGGGYKVPPIPPGGLANPPMGLPPGMRFPQKGRGGWRPSRGLLREIATKAKAFERIKQWTQDFMWPDSPAQVGEEGWNVPANWTRCPTPDWAAFSFCGPEPDPTHYAAVDGIFDNSTCAPIGFCPGSQVIPSALPLPVANTPPFRVHYYHKTGEPNTFSWLRTYNVPAASTTNDAWTVGRVILPDEFADPFAQPEPRHRELVYGRTSPKTHTPAWVQPALDFGPAPGGVPGKPTDHWPLPPVRPDREKKPFPGGVPYGEFGKWYGRFTELNDMLDCMMEAAGEKPPKGPLQKRLKQVWDRYNDPDKPAPDGNAFAACMARENAQDMAIGKLSKGATRAMNRSPYASQRPGGYRGGGWGSRMHNFGG